MEMTSTKLKCPICGKSEFSYPNSFEICPVCEWENDEFQIKHPDEDGYANELSLNEYKTKWLKNKKVAV